MMSMKIAYLVAGGALVALLQWAVPAAYSAVVATTRLPKFARPKPVRARCRSRALTLKLSATCFWCYSPAPAGAGLFI